MMIEDDGGDDIGENSEYDDDGGGGCDGCDDSHDSHDNDDDNYACVDYGDDKVQLFLFNTNVESNIYALEHSHQQLHMDGNPYEFALVLNFLEHNETADMKGMIH